LQRTIAAALYWLAAVTIALGAYGHGFVGVVPRARRSRLCPSIPRACW